MAHVIASDGPGRFFGPVSIFLLLAQCCFFANAATAASFDCTKAQEGSAASLICRSKRLSKLDDELLIVYRARVAENPAVRAAQRRWLNERGLLCGSDDIAPSSQGRAAECLAVTISKRVDELSVPGPQNVDFELPPLPCIVTSTCDEIAEKNPPKKEPPSGANVDVGPSQSASAGSCGVKIVAWSGQGVANNSFDARAFLSRYRRSEYEAAFNQFGKCVENVRAGNGRNPGFCGCEFTLDPRGSRNTGFFEVKYGSCAASSPLTPAELYSVYEVLKCHQETGWRLAR